jgi:DNA-binding CsgD family transcriptional regulator
VARYIVDLKDGFSLDDGRPRAARSSDDAALQQSIQQATQRVAREQLPEVAVMAITRPSGRRAFPLMVAPLLNAPPESTLLDAMAVLYISDLEGGTLHRSEVLREVYGLTEAETQLVELLCDGHSLEEIAARRGVTLNTARSQLKQVFAKTNTHRQSELVRLVLAAIAPIAHPEREKSAPES